MIYNPYPQVDLPFGKDNKYFKILFDAICKVEKRYLYYDVKSADVHKIEEINHSHLERVFAYEVYRQWGNLIEKSCDHSLILNAELDKFIEDGDIILESEQFNCSDENKLKVYPDLILHHDQGDDDIQKIVCEIKRTTRITGKLILGDLYKLCCYMTKEKFHSKYKPFRYGVFLLSGGKLSDIRIGDCEKIRHGDSCCTSKDLQDKFKAILGRIICVAYDGTTLEYETLDKICPELKQNKNELNIDNANRIS